VEYESTVGQQVEYESTVGQQVEYESTVGQQVEYESRRKILWVCNNFASIPVILSGSPDLSGPVLYRILPLSNFGGKPCRIYESRATPSGITGNNDELCRSLMCLTIFHRREDLKLQIGHCQFLLVTTIMS
jgi:hypothetical protein